ncbi:Mitogen-activated protein kinase kinase 2 [Diplonema papillatum]|nr:Mitogen-activated protein kinase kinase 2 [Diplonema papillatum]
MMKKKTLKISPEIVAEVESKGGTYVSYGGSCHLSDNTVISSSGIDRDRGSILTLKPEDIEIIGVIGQGSSGCVREARVKRTNEKIALKEIKLINHHLDEIGKELATLYKHHDKGKLSPYLIDFYGAFVEDGSAHIALQFMDGSLGDCINQNGTTMATRGVPEEILAPITKMVLKGLHYLHAQRSLVHRDLKPGNILYSEDGMIKITDFGVCQQLESTRGGAVTFVGTVTYMSPERLEGKSYESNVDIWGLGISLVELLTGNHPFQEVLGDAVNDGSQKFWKLLEHLGEKSDKKVVSLPTGEVISEQFQSFIGKCLTKEPTERTSAAELLDHPWIVDNTAQDEHVDQSRISEWLLERKRAKKDQAYSEEELRQALDKIAFDIA